MLQRRRDRYENILSWIFVFIIIFIGLSVGISLGALSRFVF